ncbi:MAG: DUF3301 domain-containing protein [Burkholderiales bacterium]
MTELAVLTACALGAAAWFSIMRAREQAVQFAKKLCVAEEVQLLDFTVALEKLALTRDRVGRTAFRRTYRFEFSDTGNNRREGRVVLIAGMMESSYMEPHLDRTKNSFSDATHGLPRL